MAEPFNPYPLLVICQDCLAVAPYSDAKHNEEELCECGGQWCGCPSCALEAGKRSGIICEFVDS